MREADLDDVDLRDEDVPNVMDEDDEDSAAGRAGNAAAGDDEADNALDDLPDAAPLEGSK